MHKPLLATLLASTTLAFAGCQSIKSITGGSAPTVAEVQADAQSICGYLPAAETVTNMITAANAAAAAGEVVGSTIANAICGAVTAKSVSRGGSHVPSAYGVAIKGHFVK